MSPKRFNRALVTGASSGIGLELCHLLASEGIDLIVVARSESRLKELKEELEGQVNVEVVAADLADRAQRKMVVDAIFHLRPDLVVNNAGWGYYGDALTHETEESMNVLEVNVAALTELSIEGARAMVSAEKRGVVMNISSAGAFQVFPSFSVYAASKAYVNLFSESFDEETSPFGVRILASCPGMVDTNFRNRASGNQWRKAHPATMTVKFAAKEVWRQILKGKSLHVFDWRYRVATFFSRFLVPKRLVAKMVRKSLIARFPKREIIKR